MSCHATTQRNTASTSVKSSTASTRRWESLAEGRKCEVGGAVVCRHARIEALAKDREHLNRFHYGELTWSDVLVVPHAFRHRGIKHGDRTTLAELESAMGTQGLDASMEQLLRKGDPHSPLRRQRAATPEPKSPTFASEKLSRKAQKAATKAQKLALQGAAADKVERVERHAKKVSTEATKAKWREQRQFDKLMPRPRNKFLRPASCRDRATMQKRRDQRQATMVVMA